MTDAAPRTDALPSEWARLNPLSPLVRAGRGLGAVFVVLALNARNEHGPPYIDLAIVGFVGIAGLVSWLVTRWRIHGSELQIDTGLVRRQSVRVPLTRLQGVDVVRPLLARMVGVAEVRLVLAGHDSGRARLAYLSDERAVKVRAQLLALAHGLADDTPEPAERPIFHVDGAQIVAANLLGLRFVIGVGLAVVMIVLAVIQPSSAVATFTSLLSVFAVTLLATFRQISTEWDFTVAEAPDGLRLRAGLLQTRSETIPYGRVQAVRWIEPLWWRPFGWVRLEVDVARRRGRDRSERESGGSTRALLPVGSRAEARWLLDRVLPGASAELPVTRLAPKRARWRAPLSRHYLRCSGDKVYLVCTTGRIRPSTVVVPLEKIQSVRWSQGPVSRWLRLASVYVDTAGQRFTAEAKFRDEREAQAMLWALPDQARSARRSASTPTSR
ncbi:MAG TPA: PH domain-containing protein [Mycobacteriales bacterium]|nr:PH domain-containing protein [Mycobacteriales bacterium]